LEQRKLRELDSGDGVLPGGEREVGEHEGHEGYLWMCSVDAGVAGGGPTMVTATRQWWQWCSSELRRAGLMGNRWRSFKGLGANDFEGQLEGREAGGASSPWDG
jgi:hypothetical protein